MPIVVGTHTFKNALTCGANITVSAGQFLAPDGSAGAPGYGFGAATNTGLRRQSSGIGFVVAGGTRWRITSGGNLLDVGDNVFRAGTGTAGAPAIQMGASTTSGLYLVGANVIGVSAAGNLNVTIGDGTLGFYGAAAVAKPTIVGAKGGNVALGNLLTALANQGLLTDSTT